MERAIVARLRPPSGSVQRITSPDATGRVPLSARSSDVFPQMRNLDEDDLRLMAAYILVAPKVQGLQWGGGKIYF